MIFVEALEAFLTDTARFLVTGIFLIAAVIFVIGLIWAMCVLAARADILAGRK